MVTKKYYRTSPMAITGQILNLIMFVFGLIGVIYSVASMVRKWWTNECLFLLFILLICLLCDAICIEGEIAFQTGIIFLDSDGIRSKGQIAISSKKTQYPAYVQYFDIETVSIIPYHFSSKGTLINSYRPLPFLFVKTKNGKIVRFDLECLPNKTVKKLLFELKTRCRVKGSDLKINIDGLVEDFQYAKWAWKASKHTRNK